MWVRLEETELQLVTHGLAHLSELGNRDKILNLIERLKEPPDPDTEKFANAVETSDDLEVDGDVVISRGDEGAFVMAWVYVTNAEAGIETDEGD